MPRSVADACRSHSRVGVIAVRDDGTLLPNGVEAKVTDLKCEYTDGSGECSWTCTLIGERVFERSSTGNEATNSPVTALPGACFPSEEVRWLDLGLSDAISAAYSPSRSVELLSRELGPLCKTWIELAKGGGSTLWGGPREGVGASAAGVDKAHLEAVVDQMLSDLGEMPGLDRPSELAIWVAALIDPCNPGSRPWPCAPGVRAAVLTADTPVQRLSAAKIGLVDSIYRLKGGKWPMDTYYW